VKGLPPPPRRRYTCLECGVRSTTWDRFRAHRINCLLQRNKAGSEEEARRRWEEARMGD
jgi:transcriptional regulator NrdR family protein